MIASISTSGPSLTEFLCKCRVRQLHERTRFCRLSAAIENWILHIMDAKSVADPVLWVARGLRKGLTLLVARIKGLRSAVRADNFRMAQRLRLPLPMYVRHLKNPVRKDIARLFEVSGLWVRNVGDRRQTKRSTLLIIRRIISRLKIPTNALWPRLSYHRW